MSDIDQILMQMFPKYIPIMLIVGALVLISLLFITKQSPEEIEADRIKAIEEKKARMQTVIVEDTKTIEDTVRKSGSSTGLVMMDGHVGMGTSFGNSRNEVVIKYYVYLRDKANHLMQFNVSTADDYAAISYVKGNEIDVEMFADGCIWQDRIKLKNKFVIEN